MGKLLVLAVLLVGAAFLTSAAARAQDTPTGSIKVHVAYQNGAAPGQPILAVVMLADTPQPIPFNNDAGLLHETGTDGTFLAADLAPGDYLVGMYLNPDAVPSFTESIVLSGSLKFPATTVHVAAGQAVTLDVSLPLPNTPAPEPPTSLKVLPRGTGSISGRVGLEGCQNCLGQYYMVIVPGTMPQRALDIRPEGPDQGYTFVTDPSGYFVVTDLAAGAYIIAAPGVGELSGSYPETIDVQTSEGITALPAKCVRLRDGESVSGVDFMIARGRPAPGGAPYGEASGEETGSCARLQIPGLTPTAPAPTPTFTFPDAGGRVTASGPFWRNAALLAAFMGAFLLIGLSVLRRRRSL